MKKGLFITLICCFVISFQAFARSFPQLGCGKIVDSYTRVLLKDFRADLLRPDS